MNNHTGQSEDTLLCGIDKKGDNADMKKWTALLLCLCLVGILTACGQTGANGDTADDTISVQTEETEQNEDTEATDSQGDEEQAADAQDTENTETADESADTAEETESSSRILVAYFSRTGNTAPLAEYVAETTGADIYEIVAEDPYTDEDIDYSVDDCRANVEQDDETCRPAISGSVENMQDYDIVFIAFPIWWGEEPRIIDTFMESYDFSGITMIPFCTSGGSGIGTAESNLHSFTTEETTWLDGERFAAGTSRETIEEWVSSLGFGEY